MLTSLQTYKLSGKQDVRNTCDDSCCNCIRIPKKKMPNHHVGASQFQGFNQLYLPSNTPVGSYSQPQQCGHISQRLVQSASEVKEATYRLQFGSVSSYMVIHHASSSRARSCLQLRANGGRCWAILFSVAPYWKNNHYVECLQIILFPPSADKGCFLFCRWIEIDSCE